MNEESNFVINGVLTCLGGIKIDVWSGSLDCSCSFGPYTCKYVCAETGHFGSAMKDSFILSRIFVPRRAIPTRLRPDR